LNWQPSIDWLVGSTGISAMSDMRLPLRMLFLVGEPDGAERVDVADLFAIRLAALGLKIDYVLFDNEATGLWHAKEWRGARAFVVGRSKRSGLSGRVCNKLIEVSADLRTFWQALTGPYDLIQVRDKFVVGVLALTAARLSGKRFVYWLSYPYAESRILDGKEGRAAYPWLSIVGGRIAAWLLYKIIMPNADHVFVQSEQMLNDIAAEGVPRELMTAVPMGVNESMLTVKPAVVEPGSILYLGTLNRVRRLDTLIEALEIVRQSHTNARLVFVGDGPEAADRDYLQQVVQRHGLSDAVEFTGALSMAEAHAYVARAAVCVSPFYPTPILQSTSPTKICEYMALGRPVVANSHPEQSVIIAGSGAGLCVEWSAAEFARAISQLLDDPAGAEVMAARGPDYVRSHRTYAVIAPLVAEKYARLLPDAISRSPAE
jgi:glycosyltransferase involved in cell wall biosynthesis